MSAISRRGWLQYRFLLKQPAAISSFYVITLHFARGSQNCGVRRSANERYSREVVRRWARLVLGWVTASGMHYHSVCKQSPRPTQPPTLRGTGK